MNTMKNHLLAVLLTLSSTGQACVSCLCKGLLDIVVQNNTNKSCYLTQQTIDAGFSVTKELPLIISPGQLSKPYSIWGTNVEITLGFQCGADKFATFATSLGGGAKPKTLTGTPLSLANLDAYYTVTPAACDKTEPVARRIQWTLE